MYNKRYDEWLSQSSERIKGYANSRIQLQDCLFDDASDDQWMKEMDPDMMREARIYSRMWQPQFLAGHLLPTGTEGAVYIGGPETTYVFGMDAWVKKEDRPVVEGEPMYTHVRFKAIMGQRTPVASEVEVLCHC